MSYQLYKKCPWFEIHVVSAVAEHVQKMWKKKVCSREMGDSRRNLFAKGSKSRKAESVSTNITPENWRLDFWYHREANHRVCSKKWVQRWKYSKSRHTKLYRFAYSIWEKIWNTKEMKSDISVTRPFLANMYVQCHMPRSRKQWNFWFPEELIKQIYKYYSRFQIRFTAG